MKFAPIVPIEYDPGKFTKYHLILAHEVLENEDLRKYYQYQGLKGHDIILDNSVIELGNSVGIELLEQAREYFPDSYLVLPDELLDMDATLHLTEKWITKHPENNRLMIVPQGRNPNEWLLCLDLLVNLVSSHTHELIVGIGRVCEDWNGGRLYLYNRAVYENLWRGQFHLLGIQHKLQEVYWAIGNEKVVGVDSSLPGRAARIGIPSDYVEDLRRIPDLTSYDKFIDDDVQREIRLVLKRLNGA